MCKICENDVEPGTKYLDCSFCPTLTQISSDQMFLQGLEELECSNCPGLVRISLTMLKVLNCSECDELIEIAHIEGLQILDCSNCKKLTQIPHIDELQELNCAGCPLTKIPCIQKLLVLGCGSCPLTEIPLINGLRVLNCSNCPKLTKIPVGQDDCLEELYCYDCTGLTELPSSLKLSFLNCGGCRNLTQIPNCESTALILILKNGCPWLNYKNKKYDENVRKLVILQKWLRRMILRKKLITLIPLLVPLYYHPDSRGGYFHKKNMLEFIETIDNKKNENIIAKETHISNNT